MLGREIKNTFNQRSRKLQYGTAHTLGWQKKKLDVNGFTLQCGGGFVHHQEKQEQFLS